MTKFFNKDIIRTSLAVFLILIFSFIVLKSLPNSPFNINNQTDISKEVYERYQLDKPDIVQFLVFVKNIINLDFNISSKMSRDLAKSDILVRILRTVVIFLGAFLIGTILGFALGIISSLLSNRIFDNTIDFLSNLGSAVPSFVFAMIFFYIYNDKFNDVFKTHYNSSFYYLIMPVTSLAIFSVFRIGKYISDTLKVVLGSKHFKFAKTKGLYGKNLYISHLVKNLSIHSINVFYPIATNILTSSIVVELILGIPGIGTLLASSIKNENYLNSVSLINIYAFMYILIVLFSKFLYSNFDPRSKRR